ncbi:endonuclease [Marivirga lumbricoides]
MKNFYRISAPLLIFLLSLLSFNATSQVQNGDFENWAGGEPGSWTTIDAGIAVTQNTSIVKEGNSSAKITVNTSTQSNTDFLQSISVNPGQSYNFSTWVYHTEGGVRARLYVDGYQGYSNPNRTNQWQQINFNYTPTSSSIVVGLRFYDVSGFDGSEVVYVDDFSPSTAGGGNGGDTGNCTDVALSLTTDNYASETSWAIKDAAGVTLYSESNLSNNTTYTETFCLENGNYSFTISDSYGDGICCSFGNGSFALNSGGTNLGGGGSFGSSETVNFTIGASDPGNGGSGYYSSASGLTGYPLKTALYNIIKGHDSQGYSALWSFYAANELDMYYENDGSILDIYSEKPAGTDAYSYAKSSDQCGSYSGEGNCYNREHSFPRSWFGGDVEPMNSDVHHIFATDGFVNSKRSSFPYGEVGSASYVSSNGSKLGNAASGLGYSGTVFEPIDEFKGDIARAAFYMATRYENVIAGWENNSSYSDAVLDGSSAKVFEGWALALLISWHNNDPVSAKEIARNEAAFVHQGNRNPFVDHPEYVAAIWGSNSSARALPQISTSYQQHELTVNHGLTGTIKIAIFDASGRQIMEYNRPSNQSPTANLPVKLKKQSLYVVKVYSEKKVMTKKFVVIE